MRRAASDDARTAGRHVVDEARAAAHGEVADTVRTAGAELAAARAASDELEPRCPVCRAGWPTASSVSTEESLMSTFIGQLVGFAVIVIRGEVRRTTGAYGHAQAAGRRARRPEESRSAAAKLASADGSMPMRSGGARRGGAAHRRARSDSTGSPPCREQAAVDAERIKARGFPAAESVARTEDSRAAR